MCGVSFPLLSGVASKLFFHCLRSISYILLIGHFLGYVLAVLQPAE